MLCWERLESQYVVPKPLKNLFVASILSFGKQKNNGMHARHVDGDVWSGKHGRSIGTMTEQQVAAQSAKETETGNREKMTQLEGIRQKVFMDRYSLKDASGNALEHYPEQMWARVARGIAEVEKTPEARAEWEKKFYETLADFQFVPGGRILAGAGSGHAVTFYNCMPPDQEVLTDKGYRPIAEIKVGDLVVTHRKRLRPV